ncbi:hypothetical protein Tco_0356082 [Tanacetum coccineum]
MQYFKLSQSIIPFPSRLIDDSYEEKEALKSLLMDKPRMGYQIEASMNVHDSTILEDSLPPKEKDLGNMLEDVKVPLILRRPFLSTAHAKIDVLKRKITLKVGNDKIMFKSNKPTGNIIKSLDPTYGDYIELNDLNEPLELRRN